MVNGLAFLGAWPCRQGGVLLLDQLFQEQGQGLLALQVPQGNGATGGHAVEDEE